MNETMKNYPPLENLEGKTVEELLKLRQSIREVRDQRRTVINDEITTAQSELRRDAINQRRIFDIELNELKRQLTELGPNAGSPAVRVKLADVREKISDLKYKYSLTVLESETKDAKLANDRVRRKSENQLEYENLEIDICKVIRDKGGFKEYGFKDQSGNTDNDED